MTVPQKLLDTEKSYRICYRVVKQRKPYFTETEDEKNEVFQFSPVVGVKAKGYFIADAHNKVAPVVGAAKRFEEKYGEINFLILAGDIPNDSGNVENFSTIYEIADQITGGAKPIVYAKGNHDLRGICAERMEDYTPNLYRKSYFTFKIGDIWGISLDCGEDKDDSHAEYGHTVCCHQFRMEETEFIRDVIKNAANEYLAEGVKLRMVVVHNPFSEQLKPPFNIEKEIFSQWGSLLRENMKPDIMLSGHFHKLAINEIGSDADHLGQPCRVVIGSKPFTDPSGIHHFAGTGLFFSEEGIDITFIDDLGNDYISY